jgi:hypothetical protein
MAKQWKQKQTAKKRYAAKRALLIRNALGKSVNAEQVVKDFLAMQFTGSITTEEGRAWARIHIHPDSKPLSDALGTLYSESYVLGQDIAMHAITKAKINKAPTMRQLQNAASIDWKNWKPGNRAAAQLVRPSGGLQSLLDRRGVTIQGINGTTLDRIGTLLAKALQEGVSPSEIAPAVSHWLGEAEGARAQYLEDKWTADVDNILTDSERALMIAQTEMSSAVSVAARELYQETGVELVEWLVADPCDECQENADVSPIGIDDTFPSGDTEPPAHPNCVCDLAPYVVDTANIGEDALSLLLDGEDL